MDDVEVQALQFAPSIPKLMLSNLMLLDMMLPKVWNDLSDDVRLMFFSFRKNLKSHFFAKVYLFWIILILNQHISVVCTSLCIPGYFAQD